MKSQNFTVLITFILSLYLLVEAKDNRAQSNDNKNQPLGNLDKLLRQSNAPMRIDNLMDNKLATNITNMLSEMALNMNKMVLENKRLTSQLQEVITRVQNSTGINGTNAITKLQQQAPNITTSLNDISLNNLNRFSGTLQTAS